MNFLLIPKTQFDHCLKHLGGQVVSAPGFVSWGPRFESHLLQNSAHDCTALHCTEPFIIILQSSPYDLHNVERNITVLLQVVKLMALFKF